jgi:glycosyltransferase involved in cell wall biosynthesis
MQLHYDVEIASLDAPGAPWECDFDCPVHLLGPSHLKYRYAPRYLRWMRAHARDFDAVIVNGLWQYHGFATWRALRDSGVPYFVFTHGMLDPWFKRRSPLKHLKKWLYWPWAEYRVLRDARAVFFTCEDEKLLSRESFGLYRANEVVVSYGTPGPSGDPETLRRAFLEQFPQLRDRRSLLFLSRIHPKKGCDLLVDAFASVAGLDPSLQLVMAGPDSHGLRARLESRLKRAGLDARVTWTGMLQGDVKWGAFYAADAFVLPSHQENFGIAVAEALACGVPVLISNKVNIWREISGDDAGLVADDTAAGTQQLLHRWLGLEPLRRQEMARNAVNCFQRRFHIGTATRSLISAMEAHTNGGRGRVPA